jgi:hypothetical protein
MSTSSEAIAQLLANNEKYTSTFNGAPTMEQIRAVSRSKDGRPLFIRE